MNQRGTEVWRIENFQLVPLPESDYGKFYSGDSYIILRTSAHRGGAYVYDIHFWIGKHSTQDEFGTAAIKTIELGEILGGRAIQHREIQGHESGKFLYYFKPCIVPLQEGFASGFKRHEEQYEIRLYVCRGNRVARMNQVPVSLSSLNHDHIFILDTESKVYQFNGKTSSIQERAKALEVITYLKDKFHSGRRCGFAIVDDGECKPELDSESGEFWAYFGGFAPIAEKAFDEKELIPNITAPIIYSLAPVDDRIAAIRIVKDDQNIAKESANSTWDALNGKPAQGGTSSCYKKLIKETKLIDRTYSSDGMALIQIPSTAFNINKAIQVDAAVESLCSLDCFLLQAGDAFYAWHGNSSTVEQQQLAETVTKHLKVSEIYNFSQDDLLTEDMLILDAHAEVFIWIGRSVDPKEKRSAFDVGQACCTISLKTISFAPFFFL
ncbi:Villin-3 [Rhynchospora pubera]|uniref:Villin-3 n=1 Tax=Rhynchospora pubera TaxID=906938 RepID=A0AAV8GN51_9POAL|nr:Villin-3 [Rhynchospora pubera]